MKMKYIPILLLWLVSGLCAGCSDFFEESSQNLFYVTDVADLDELLVGECYISTEGFEATSYSSSKLLMSKTNDYFPWIHILDDDSEAFAVGEETTTTRPASI